MKNLSRRQALKSGLTAIASSFILPNITQAINKDEIIINPFVRPNIIKNKPYGNVDWNNLETKNKREELFNEFLEEDLTNKIPPKPINNEWICYHYLSQILLNFPGYNGDYIPEKFDTTNLGKFNLPVYGVYINKNFGGEDHAINCILTGDENNGDPRIFENWYFFEPQNDKKVEIGDWNMPKNVEIYIVSIKEFIQNSYMFRGYSLIKFKLNNFTPQLIEDSVNPNLILERPNNPTFVAQNKPLEFNLNQNYPNPFNAQTKIEYNLENPGNVSLEIYNINGQKLETLVNNYMPSGKHSINWNADKYSSGIYFYRLKTNNSTDSKKMTLIK